MPHPLAVSYPVNNTISNAVLDCQFGKKPPSQCSEIPQHQEAQTSALQPLNSMLFSKWVLVTRCGQEFDHIAAGELSAC